MKGIETILFDFDGVILESLEIKGWAFKKLFEEHREQVEEIVSFHYANGGMSRFDKFHHIYKEILKKPLPSDEFEMLCERFSTLVYDRVLRCAYVPGALEFIEKYHRTTKLFIISGTPHDEISQIVKARDLMDYFKGVFGSPNSKGAWVQHVLKEWNIDPDTCIFIGDALSDYLAAYENNIRFVARIIDDDSLFDGKRVYHKVKNLFELDSFFKKEGALL